MYLCVSRGLFIYFVLIFVHMHACIHTDVSSRMRCLIINQNLPNGSGITRISKMSLALHVTWCFPFVEYYEKKISLFVV